MEASKPRIRPSTERIPPELQSLDRWVNWQALRRDGAAKLAKVPVNSRTGGNAQSNNPGTWSPFGDARSYWEKHAGEGLAVVAGIGIMLGDLDDGTWLVGADFDNCVHQGPDKRLVIDPDIRLLIDRLPGYVEFSPSATGVKVLWRTSVDLSGLTRSVKDRRGRGFEFYVQGRYFATTGMAVQGRESFGGVVDEDWANWLDEGIVDAVTGALALGVEDAAPGPVRAARPVRLATSAGEVVDPFERMAEKVSGWPLERVKKELLSNLDPDCPYKVWLDVCFGMHHQSDGDEEWFEAFDEWSAGGSKYKGEEETREKWNSVRGRPGGKITLASALWHLKQSKKAKTASGIERIEAAADVEEVKGIAEEMRAIELEPVELERAAQAVKKRLKDFGTKLTIVAARAMVTPVRGSLPVREWAADLVYVSSEKKWYDSKGASYTGEGLNDMFSAQTPPAGNGGGGRLAPIEYVRVDADPYIPKVVGRRFRPDIDTRIFEEHGQLFLNSYIEGLRRLPVMPVEIEQRAIDTVMGHLRWLLPDEREHRLLLDALCWIAQNPGRQLRWMPLLIGAVGAGKSFFEVLMRAVLGPEWVHPVDHDRFNSQFNGWATGALLVVLSEVRFSSDPSRHSMMDRLKPYLTDRLITIEQKGVDAYQTNNVANYLAMSNHEDAIPVGDDTRRVAVFSSPRTEEEIVALGQAYYDTLFDAVDRHPGSLRRWMLEHSDWHPDFQPGGRAPVTAGMLEMQELTEDPVIERVRAAVGGSEVVLTNHVESILKARGHHHDVRRIRIALRKLGMKTKAGVEGAVRWNGTMVRPYATQKIHDLPREMFIDRVREALGGHNSDGGGVFEE